MALQSVLKKFYFYQKYTWSPQDFTDFQSLLLNTLGLLSGGSSSIISGCRSSAGGGMTVSIASGVCFNNNGYPMYIPTTQTATVATPVGQPAISLIVARPLLTDADNIPEPTNPSNSVPLHQIQGFQIVVLNGTPAATPVAPTPADGDVVLTELSLTAGQSTITSAAFRYNLVSRPIKRNRRITRITSNYTCDGTEDVIEVDATGGAVTVTFASASIVPGSGPTVVKVDISTNKVTLSAADLISGQSAPTLDSQWDVASTYSNGQAYRQIG